MSLPRPVKGMFANSMEYARWGDSERNVLYIPGGPGSEIPSGLGLRFMLSAHKPLVGAGFTVWMVGRAKGMPPGHTIGDMADDYAQLIDQEFDGRVEVVVGTSYGGIIGFYLAANHADSFQHMVIAGAACDISAPGKDVDYRYALAMSEGRAAEAGSIMFRSLLPRLRLLEKPGGWIIGRMMASDSEHFQEDILVEGKAERAYDARGIIPSISVPVLLIGGDRDTYFPMALIEETAALLPDCTLRVYEGRGHTGLFTDRRFAQDILEFVERSA